MNPTKASAGLVAIALTWSAAAGAQDTAAGAQDATAEPPAAAPAPPPAASAPAPAPGARRDIEDVELDKLLDVKLEEELGTTAAVSRRTESVLRAPATMSTLDADRIALSGATTVAELLRWVPGVQVIRNAAGNWAVSLRGAGGLGGNDLVVLIDGMAMNSPLDGSVQWDLMPVNVGDIERIEVVRGPVSPVYGPNAYTGVINIVTRESGFSPSATVARTHAGVDAAGRPLSSSGGRIARTGERLRAAWYWNLRYDATNARAAGGAEQPPWAAIGTTGRLAYKVTEGGNLSLEVGLSRSNRSELDHLALQSGVQTRSQLLAIARYQQAGLFGGPVGFDAWARANAQHIDHREHDHVGFEYAHTTAMRAEGGGDLSLKLSGLNASAGANVTGEHINAPYIHPAANGQVRLGYGLYGSATASPWRQLDLSLSARGDAPPTLGRLEGSYRASAVLHGETTAVRLSAGSSYRAPSWVEAAGRFVDPTTGLILLEGTPSIAPPRNDAVELGVVWGPTVNFQLTPTVYASRLTNVVVQDFAPLVRKTFRNDPADRFVVGGELEANWRIRENLHLHAWGGVLGFPDAPARVATVGVPSQNSALTGGAHLRTTLWNERLGLAFGARSFSSRSYSVRAGIPPQIRAVDVPDAVALEAAGEVRPFRAESVWASLRATSNLPHGMVESPLPNAAGLGTVIVFGLEYRGE
jgi:outer membrane cobalamin receptor